MNQPTAAPTAKMTAVGVSGAIVTLVGALCAMFGVQVPENVSGALLVLVPAAVTIVTFAAGYFKKERSL